MGIVRRGSRVSSAAIAMPSMARKNQIARGTAASMPLAVKFAALKAAVTAPMNTSSSATARTVTNSSKIAAMRTPTLLSVTNTA